MTAEDLAQKIGDYCHTKYMGCAKARDTGLIDYDFDYSYTDEVVNMVSEYFKTDEGKQALNEFTGKKDGAIFIKGSQYELASYGEPYSDGSRAATLRLAN